MQAINFVSTLFAKSENKNDKDSETTLKRPPKIKEPTAVQIFCVINKVFISIQKDALSSGSVAKQALVEAIKKAKTFSDVLLLIDNFTLENERKMKTPKPLIKPFIFLGSLINSEAHFLSLLPSLQKEVIAYASLRQYNLGIRSTAPVNS